MSDPLAVGLVGAGPWAAMVHAPMLAAGPETRLVGVWARRPEAAARLAEAHGTTAAADLDELVGRSQAVAFCVPPDVQAALAPGVARRGRAVLLEKPVADSLDGARRLADAVGEAGVGSLVVLTTRFTAAVRDFLAAAAAFDASGGRSWFISGAFLSGPFAASPWRQRRGTLLDVGPHAVDLVTAALGPAVDVWAHASAGGWVGLALGHEGGAVSEVSLCSTTDLPGGGRSGAEVFGPAGVLEIDTRAVSRTEAFATVRAEFAAVARTGAAHPCDVRRGLELQAVIERAERRLAGRDG